MHGFGTIISVRETAFIPRIMILVHAAMKSQYIYRFLILNTLIPWQHPSDFGGGQIQFTTCPILFGKMEKLS